MEEFLHGDRWAMPSEAGLCGLTVTVPLRNPPKYEVMLPQIVEMAEAGSGVDLISQALGIGAESSARQFSASSWRRSSPTASSPT